MVTEAGPGVFGGLLQRHRLAAGLSQEELAERAGLSRRGSSDLERGARRAPHPATVRRLAEGLGLTGADRAALVVTARTAAGSATVERAEGLAARGRAEPLTNALGRDRDPRERRALSSPLTMSWSEPSEAA